MRDNPKVVSMKRNAAYLHHRAMLNRRDNRIVDALELMRGAVEASPENHEYRLDLAELYCEMGCHEQSTRLLLDMLTRADAPSECFYGLALNQLGMNDLSGARQSLAQYRRRDPEGAHSEDVSQLAMELEFYGTMNRPASRRLYRAMRVANRACDALREDEPEKACRLFRRSLSVASEQFEMRALYAMALLMAGKGEEARREADRASEGYPPSVKAMCVCAQVYAMLGDSVRADRLMQAAEAEHPAGQDLQLMLYAAGEMRMDERAAEYARLALQETPFNRELLHIRAVALKRSGASDGEAARCWERILRIDPEDSIAAFYREAAESGALDQMPLEFSYQVPPEEYMRRLKRLAGHLNGGFAHVHEAWETDTEFRKLIRWAVAADDQRLGRASMTVLATLESPEAVRALREAMFAPDVSRELKLHAAVLLKVQGREIEQVLPEPMASGGALVDTEALLGALPVGDRQLVRYADEVLEQEYGVAARPALTLMWSGYRRMRGTKGDPLKRVEAAAAALAYNYLLAGCERPSIARLAKLFGCTPRQLTFCAERIASCLEQDGAEPNSEEKR